MMNQPYIGPDVTSRIVAGVIRRIAACAKGGQPISYLVQLYPNEGGVRSGNALVPADLVRDHLAGLVLVREMERDNE